MTLRDAVHKKISRVRLPHWAEPTCYLKIDLFRDGHGPWVHLYSPVTQKAIGAPCPQDILCLTFPWDEDGWDEYTGEISEGDSE